MRKPIRIAQIGINRYSHSGEIFYTLGQFPELFEIAGYAIVEDERETCAQKRKDMVGYPELAVEEILNDPTIEAVAVETDEIHLLKYAQMAAEHGKHIHMEKPGSQDIPAFERLIETVRKSGKVFHIGYMYRYNPFIADAVRRAKAGEFGQIFSVEAHMSRYDPKETREWFGTFKGGMMFYLGCHLVDLVLQIQGTPTRVIPLNTVTVLDGVRTEDLGFAVLQYPHATSVIRMGGVEVGGSKRRQLVICGENRTVEIRPLEKSVSVASNKYTYCTQKTERYFDDMGSVVCEDETSEPFGRYDGMMIAFAEMVRGEKENPYTLDYELELFRTVMRCCGATE